MNAASTELAAIAQPTSNELALSGCWTARGASAIERIVDTVRIDASKSVTADGSRIEALDTVGAWMLQKLLVRLREEGIEVKVSGLRPPFAKLLEVVAQQVAENSGNTAPVIDNKPNLLERVGRGADAFREQTVGLLGFVGETAYAFAGCVARPAKVRWRPILFNIRTAGFDAMPIVGLLSFLLGVVVAYQGADQLRQYGTNIFVVDLIGLSMLREFAPLITAIILARRSGSAYAAQIGTMAVTE